ncbi:molybdopterin molybdotransferase MoeA [Emticicia sp. 21SJ11W-3]|uniref:molybdopterin molybdotransferase MoeA n=1 Tax=Emticicia sp. 21SJ11W-3 TaxID=2916755 RepID=UPI00209FB3EA|nr:molybdopterin molybdotransferase MoeA [Emticicia sp. 21SJ11W-3]UTA68541.1 molybdopterin molybdotransferase MoeA [Emticicia sp. 21SJ11W-3]
MITVEQAESIILSQAITPQVEKVAIEDATGRILAEDFYADRDFPPFNRVSMDGIALAFKQIVAGQVSFRIESTAAAGKPQVMLQNPMNCIEVMTGAILPDGTDTVIRYEDVTINDSQATINVIPAEQGLSIHKQGADKKKQDKLVKTGTRITPAEIGIAATIGKHEILVQKKPTAVLIATGEEIIPVTETPLPHQIRTSNSYALQACLKSWGVHADIVLLPDNQETIEQKIKEFLDTYDVLVLSGGVSAGKFDFVPAALENQGVHKLFHKVGQRPGKPFWFGVKDTKVVFALPGNPVSTFMCLHRYFKPWLDVSQGMTLKPELAELSVDFEVNFPLTFFMQVRMIQEPGGIVKAIPVAGNGSGDLTSLIEADAFMELPMGKGVFRKGELYPVWRYRQ